MSIHGWQDPLLILGFESRLTGEGEASLYLIGTSLLPRAVGTDDPGQLNVSLALLLTTH